MLLNLNKGIWNMRGGGLTTIMMINRYFWFQAKDLNLLLPSKKYANKFASLLFLSGMPCTHSRMVHKMYFWKSSKNENFQKNVFSWFVDFSPGWIISESWNVWNFVNFVYRCRLDSFGLVKHLMFPAVIFIKRGLNYSFTVHGCFP